VSEDVGASAVRREESEAIFGVEPPDGNLLPRLFLSACYGTPAWCPGSTPTIAVGDHLGCHPEGGRRRREKSNATAVTLSSTGECADSRDPAMQAWRWRRAPGARPGGPEFAAVTRRMQSAGFRGSTAFARRMTV